MLLTPEWGRIRAAQAAAPPLAGPERPTVVAPSYREVAGRTVRMAEAGDPDKPTVLFLGPRRAPPAIGGSTNPPTTDRTTEGART